jgi:N-acetylmuramoyl-L-alanine amidase
MSTLHNEGGAAAGRLAGGLLRNDRPLRHIVILPGHGGADPGAVANGYQEAELAKELGTEVYNVLKHMEPAQPVSYLAISQGLPQKIQMLNSKYAAEDVVLNIHFNAATPVAKGVEAYVHDETSAENRALATHLVQYIATNLRSANRGVKSERQSQHSRLGILHTKPRVILLEVCFITNKDEISEYHNKQGRIAHLIANTLLQYV